MATMNGPRFVNDFLRRKGRPDFTTTLKDPRQWPTLGESSSADFEQKRKLLPTSSVLRAGPRAKVNSCGDSSATSHSSSHTDSIKTSESDSVDGPRVEPCSPPQKASESLQEPASCAAHTAQNDEEQENAYLELQRRNSVEETNARRKAVKTKWIPLNLPRPNTGLSIQDKLRMRRQQEMRRFGPPVPAAGYCDASERPRPPPRTYGYSGSYYSYNNAPHRPYHSASYRAENFGTQNQSYGQRNFCKPRPKLARKMLSFRNRDIMYDSEFAGRDGDVQSDGADDASVTEGYENYNNGYYGEPGCETPVDWNYYSEANPMDASYLSVSSDGYGGSCTGEEYDPAYYYGVDMSGSMEYVPEEEPIDLYAPASEAQLKEMIKYQIEYYFSPDNLQKDFFLRRNMGDDGSVPLSLVASFERVRALSQDFYQILEAVGDSDRVELMQDFMIRSRDQPEMWPLKDEDANVGSYYFTDGQTPVNEYANWAYYEEDVGLGSEKTTADDENESGHYEDDFDGEEEEGEESREEEVSVDGSELSDLSAELHAVKIRSDLGMVAGGILQEVM